MEEEEIGFLIRCPNKIGYGWMTFASWYSFYKNIPDAQIAIFAEKGMLLDWCWKLKIPFSTQNDKFECFNGKKVIEISPTVMAVRPYNSINNIGPSDAKSGEFTTLVDYNKGCGNFVTSEWINKYVAPPFGNAVKSFGRGASMNELKILSLWDKCSNIYLGI